MKKRIISLLLAVVMIVGMLPLSVITASAAAVIPTSYSSKDLGYTTEVKNQYNTSCSWAYAATSMMETFLKKNNMYEGALSPLHMAYAQSSDSDAGWVARRGFLTSGGDSTMAIGFCTSPIGFRESYLEDLEVMDISKEITPELEVRYREIAKQFDENSEKKFVVDSIAFLDPEDTDAIKNAIIKYGSASVTFKLSYDNFNENRDAYYASEQPGEDSSFLHSVLVIGWDDEFSRDNFAQKPENNGAWLCQNSWGADAGNEGCFYVSYDDVSFLDSGERIWAIDHVEKDEYTDNFCTLNENCGVMSDYTVFNNLRIVDFCNKYTFKKYEALEKVFFETPSVGAEYTIFLIPALDNGTPSKDNWTEIGRGRVLHAGYTSADVKDVDVSEKTCFIGIRLANSIANIKMGMTTDVDNYFIHKNSQEKTSFTRKTDQDFYELSDPERENARWAINVLATRRFIFGFEAWYDDQELPIPSQTLIIGEKIPKPEYQLDDYSIVWYKDSLHTTPWDFDNDVFVIHNYRIYGKLFSRYTVMLNSDGGVGGTESIKVGYGDTLPEIEVPTKDGFVFDGYYDKDGVQYYDADGKALKVWDKDNESEELFACYLSTTHVHTFADTYTYNETGHWHACTEEGCYIKNYATCGIEGAAYGKHVFDESGHCICGMTHIHSFSTDWQHDETGHWHVCTAEGCTIKDYATCGIEDAAYGEHVFDESGHCICGMSHIHSFSTDWQHDETGHWHACTAEDCTIKDYATCGIEDAAYGEHVFDESGHCICGISNIHSFSTDWQNHETGHWHICTADDCYIKDYATCGIEDAAYGEHTYVDGKCTVCKKEQSPEGAKNDAVRVIQNTVDHSEDAVLKVLASTAVDAIQSAGTVAEVIVARNYWLTAINKQLGTLTHTHTFADGYTYNELVHWRVCTCEDADCEGLVSGFATHTFTVVTNDDGSKTYTCACGYTKTVYEGGSTEGELVQGVVKCDGISLTLGSDISINFYMQLTDEALANGKMVFTIGNRTVEGVSAQLNESNKRYYFACPLNALEMAETVTATFTYGSTTYTQTYSVKQYIETILNGKDKQGNDYSDEMKLLARKIANYGYYAQLYLESIHSSVKIGTDGYAQMLYFNQDDIDVDKAKELQDNFTATANTANLTFDGRTVYFDSATALNFYVITNDGNAPTATCDKGKNVEVKLYKDKIYIVSVKDITATELGDTFTVTIGEGTDSMTLKGSVLDYCAAVINAHRNEAETKDTLAINAMAAFCEYYTAAVEYAEASKPVYKVTFYMNAHCASIDVNVKHGEKVARPNPDPVSYGYVFDGWYEDDTFNIPWNFDTPITDNTTINAKWISEEDFNSAKEDAKSQISNLAESVKSTINSLNLPNDIKQTYLVEVDNEAHTAAEKIENAEYTDKIKSIVIEADNKINNILQNAKAAVIKYTVTFNMMGHGTAPSSQTVENGGKATMPATPAAEGYLFGGWYKDQNLQTAWNFDTDTVTADTTIYAKWTSDSQSLEDGYYLAGTLNGGSFWDVSSLNSGMKLEVNAAVPGEYKIDRIFYEDDWVKVVKVENGEITAWYKDGEDNHYTVSADEAGEGTLYFRPEGDLSWTYIYFTVIPKEAPKYTVTFNMMGHGTAPSSQTVEKGGKVTKPDDPAAEGYLFSGWYKDENLQTAWNFNLDKVTADTTLYAKWTENSPAEEYIYLNTGGSNLWNQESATFSVWTWGGNLTNSKAITMTKVSGDIYKVKKSDVGTNIIFIRVAFGKTFDGSDWSNNTILNQTADLSVPDKAKSMYTITGWSSSDGYWGIYGA